MRKKLDQNIKLRDILTIEVIDKKTGKIIEKETTERSIGSAGSAALMYLITGHIEDANTIKGWRYVYLFAPDKTKIKVLSGTWSAVNIADPYSYAVMVVTDDSTDSYTTGYQGLYWRDDAIVLGQMAIFQTQTKTKAWDQVLRITWEIRVPHSAYPR